MHALDRKLLRDLVHIWPQALAIALVLAAGVATEILAMGAYRSLAETRAAYYERHSFADVFATLTRAPKWLEAEIREIPHVAAVETRIQRQAVLDIEGYDPPATAVALSLPDHHQQRLNRIHLRAGRPPEPGRSDEAMVNEAFATAHRLVIGSTIAAVLNGHKQRLRIVGIALSPEYIYAIGPGDLMPDDRRFAVLWMSEKALAAIFDLDGAFNQVSLKLTRPDAEADVIDRLDGLTARFGGTGAIARKDQLSHAFLDAELNQLQALARIIPPIFLFVTAFLINMTLTRLIDLEREQIGLLKALGYGRGPIGAHYFKLVLALALVGIAVGFALGTAFGFGLTRLYAEFFHFPFLIFERDAELYLVAAGLSGIAALAGAMRAVWSALRLPPAVAMQPPAPPRYRRLAIERAGFVARSSQLTLMSLRHLVRWPLRSAMTMLGVALATALLVVSLFSLDSVEEMVNVSFSLAQRQDGTLNFPNEKGRAVVEAVGHLPGVLRVEPFRTVLARLRHGSRHRKIAIYGKPATPQLSRVVDRDNRAVTLPPQGLMVDERVAQLLDLKRGDELEVEFLEGRADARRGHARETRRVPVTAIIRSYFGLTAFMEISALNDLLDEGPVVTGVHFSYDRAEEHGLFAAIKSTPAVSSVALLRLSVAKFRETLAQNINYMVSVYTGLAVVVAFGVIYNSARIQLSEQARELASLRVLGFTRKEVSRVLLVELGILVLLAQPLGWLIGFGFGWLVIGSFESDLYRVPLVIETSTYAASTLVAIAAALFAALLVRARIDGLDLIAVLKTRD